MFRLEAELELFANQPAPPITLRGYNVAEPVAVPGEFIDSAPLAVGDVVGFCPEHYDLYLRKVKKERENDKSANKSWARAAGPLIQAFLEVVYDSLKEKAPASVGKNPEEFRETILRIMESFIKKHDREFKKLDNKITKRSDLKAEDLRALLVNSAILDLFYLQGALNYDRVGASAGDKPAEKRLRALKLQTKYSPAKWLKISEDSAPDLVLPKFMAIGDVKTGRMHEEHLWTVAGYALGYESVTKTDMNLGIIYLLETANDCLQSSRSIIFWISDDMRKRFLDRRNRALNVLKGSKIPEVLTGKGDYDNYCSRCAFELKCHKSK